MPETWIGTTALSKEIGVSRKFLWNNRLKLFQAGRDYRLKNPTAYRPTYTWHRERCKAIFTRATKAAADKESSQQATIRGRGVQLPIIDGVEPYEIE
ncbi:MAG: hypothetical protein WA949_07315 [Phormidesmis sp.]